MARRMDARSSPAPRSVREKPEGFSTRIGPGYRALGKLSSKNGASGSLMEILMIPICCAPDRGPIMPPTPGFDIEVAKRIVEMRLAPKDEFEAGAWSASPALLSPS
jgi:hypothetical protein